MVRETKGEYYLKIESQLSEIERKFLLIKSRMKGMSLELQLFYVFEIDQLRRKLLKAKKELQKLSDSPHYTWIELRFDLEEIVEDLDKTLKSMY